jgi:hypothetical protein
LRKVPAAFATLAALTALLITSTAGAITNGQPDGTGHPYVVALQLLTPNGGTLCSGTLVSPTVIVTAGHCTYGVTAPVRVWNSPRVGGPPVSAGLAYTSPDFSPTFPATVPNTGDLGVVQLIGPPILLSEYGQLPSQGFLDSFSKQKGQQDLDVTILGYGLQSLAGPAFERVMGRAQIRNVNSNNVRGYGLQTSNSRGNGTGGSGTCLGDSGGPILYGESNLLIGVNSWGQNANCVGNDFSYRTDTDAARAFLGRFVPLP